MTWLGWALVAGAALLGACWALWWGWVTHEEAEQRRRIKHRVNGGSDVVAFRPIGQREKERGR